MSRNLALASRFRRQNRRKNEGGYLLLELGLVLIISTIMLAGQVNQIMTAVDEGNAISTAKYLQLLQGGLNKYQQMNDVALKTNGATITGFDNPMQPRIDELITKNYLEQGFPERTALGLTFQTTLTRTGACPSGPDCNVSGFAISTLPYRDNEGNLRMDTLSSAVQYIGPEAGMSLPESPAVLTSVGGASVANPSGAVAGLLAIRVGSGSGLLPLLAQYYKLDGSKALTGSMQANDNDINGVKNIAVTSKATLKNVEVQDLMTLSGAGGGPGSACGADGSVRKTVAGDGLVICKGGTWQLIGNVVNGVGDGLPCSSGGQIGTSSTGVGFVCNGSYWTTLNNTALKLDTCAPAGRMATAIDTREQLVCSNGRYVSLAKLLAKQVEMSRLLVVDGTVVNKPACEQGGTGSYSFHLTQTVVDVAVTPPRQAMYIAADDNGGSWSVKIRVKDNSGTEVSASNYSISAVMKLECAY